MASEPVPSPAQPWFARLGLSGKLLAIGGLAGIIVAFLPLISLSIEMGGSGSGSPFGMFGGKEGMSLPGMRVSESAMVVENWRGKVGLVGYLAALALAFVLYPPGGLSVKALGWAGAAVGVLVVVLAVWQLILVSDTGSADMMGMGSVKASVGFGAYLNVLAGALVAAGGFLKARDERLV